MSIVILSILLIFCIIKDVNERIIPNKLLMFFTIIGICEAYHRGGISKGADSIGAMGIALLVLIVPFAVGWIGGGDVKLIMTVGVFIGTQSILSCIVYTILVGALYGGINIIKSRKIRSMLEHYKLLVFKIAINKSLKNVSFESNQSEDDRGIPYSIPIAIGTILTII